MESKILQFNERLDDYSRLIETVTAFKNTQGGTLIIGIRDIDREIIRLTVNEINRYHQEIPQVIVDTIVPQIAVDLYEQHIGGKTCVTIRVFPGPQKPYFIKKLGHPGGVFIRFGSHNRKADSYAIEELSHLRNRIRYEQQPCVQISYEDLSKDLLGLIFTPCDQTILLGGGYGISEESGRTIPNVAGTLLFYPFHQNIIAESGVEISQYAGKDKQQLIKKELFTGGIIPMLDSAFSYLSTIVGTHYELKGMVKRPVDHEIPLEAICEALVNAVVRRAYNYEAATRITLFSDRIEFLNPGTFYAPIHPENLKEGLSRYRNPLIADALRKKGYMEKQGIGITLIISSCLQAGLEEPRFMELENHVKVTIYKKVKEKRCAQAHLDLYNQETMRSHFLARGLFTSLEVAQYLGRSQSMAKKELLEMQQQQIIEKVGKGRATKYRFIS